MKKRYGFAALLFLFVSLVPIHSAESNDYVVVLDISESILPYFDEVQQYFFHEILKEHVRPDDRFHLISFAERPELEISTKIQGKEDVTRALERLFLLQPLGQYTDFLLALRYTSQYARGLSSNGKTVIVILTDGIHDPPPGGKPSSTGEVKQEVATFSRQAERHDWEIKIVRFPLDPQLRESENGRQVLDELSEVSKASVLDYDAKKPEDLADHTMGTISISFPEDLGEQGRFVTVPLTLHNYGSESVFIKPNEALYKGEDILFSSKGTKVNAGEDGKANITLEFPEGLSTGRQKVGIELSFEEDLRTQPQELNFSFIYKEKKSDGLLRRAGKLPGIFLYVIIAAAVVAVYLLLRKAVWAVSFSSVFMGHGSVRDAAAPASVDKSSMRKKNVRSVSRRESFSSGEAVIEMHVAEQNPHIGFRNTHSMKEGRPRTIGGGGSDFFIFLVSVPAGIASIERNGSSYTLKPLKPEYFPDVSEAFSYRLGREVTVRSEKGKEIKLRFTEYISPLEQTNRILHLADQPGIPSWYK